MISDISPNFVIETIYEVQLLNKNFKYSVKSSCNLDKWDSQQKGQANIKRHSSLAFESFSYLNYFKRANLH